MAERIGKNHLHGKALSLWGCLMVRDDIGVPVDDLTDSLLLFVSELPGNDGAYAFTAGKIIRMVYRWLIAAIGISSRRRKRFSSHQQVNTLYI